MEGTRCNKEDMVCPYWSILGSNHSSLHYGQEVPLHTLPGNARTHSRCFDGDLVYLINEYDPKVLRLKMASAVISS